MQYLKGDVNVYTVNSPRKETKDLQYSQVKKMTYVSLKTYPQSTIIIMINMFV